MCFQFLRRTAILMAFLPLVFVSSGCKKEQLEQLTENIKQATMEKLESVQVAPPSGEIQLTVDAPVKANAGNLRVLTTGDGRPSVLQIRSYDDPARETFPSILFQGATQVTEPTALAGQTVSGKLYFRATSSAPIWFTPDDQTVSIALESIEGQEVIGKIVSGQLMGTDGRSMPVTGTFRAVFAAAQPASAPAAVTPAATTSGAQP